MKKILLLGSTGTIGIQALQIIEKEPQNFKLVGISGHQNTKLLGEQYKKYNPSYVAITDETKVAELEKSIPKNKIISGKNAIIDLIEAVEVDLVCIAIVGLAALLPTMKAIELGRDLAIASKEVLVAAGHIVMKEIKRKKSKLYPIDSEHAAVMMCLQGLKTKDVQEIVLTASGGPFWNRSDLSTVTIKEALKHPNWTMGNKITIDSATMVNKGLEVIEAHWLFGTPYEKIKVMIHPQSIVHGMVKCVNGAVISQMSLPDMKMPIHFALHGGKVKAYQSQYFDMTQKSLEFYNPDMKKFRGLSLAYEVGKKGHSLPTVFNSANEEAVSMFLSERIKYNQIIDMIDYALDNHAMCKNPSIEDIIRIDKDVRAIINEKYSR
ncbi:MAG: 1-deoxy-D-xylulose-5-phosphate reductoisomerase [Candidatus Margulisbacteria bacterium GWF2_35_9]|nr:MAG: 1-deoxy-D-xylulose-5-phosphate reductoisomerase [Candidatus Margulisbacteria bacterium GWF2_35_9]